MNVEIRKDVMTISAVAELNAVTAVDFRGKAIGAMPERPYEIEIDLSATRFVDSSGLGALFSIYKTAIARNPRVRLRVVDPKPSVQELFELTQLHQLFEICKSAKIT